MDTQTLPPLALKATRWSEQLNWFVERCCAVLLVLLVLDVWLGVMARYVLPISLTFTEEAARYLMIWMALLAISCGIARREHIGVLFVFDRLPGRLQHVLLGLLDALALVFFGLLFFYGIGLVGKGFTQFTMIYGMPKALPFAAVPTGALLAMVQILLVAIRDQYREQVDPAQAEAPPPSETPS